MGQPIQVSAGSSDAIRERYLGLYTGAIADMLDKRGTETRCCRIMLRR